MNGSVQAYLIPLSDIVVCFLCYKGLKYTHTHNTHPYNMHANAHMAVQCIPTQFQYFVQYL